MAKLSADKRRGKPPILTGEEMLLVARLAAQGRSATAIARILTRPSYTDPVTGDVLPARTIAPDVVARWLRRARQPAEDVHMALASLRVQAVEHWGTAMSRGARDGRHAPAKDLLVATGVIADRAADRVVILIGTGHADVSSLPTLPARPVIDVAPIPLPTRTE